MSSETTSARGEAAQMNWVHDVGGRPRVRWWRIVAVLAVILAGEFLGATIVGWFTDTSIHVAMLLTPLCMAGAYFVVVVELQLQRLQHGAWRFRYGLRSILLLTAIAAAFFALTSSDWHKTQREFAFNAELKRDLEAVIQDGTVSISNPGGRGILCQVTRSSFSDDDLAKVIDLASQGSTHTCELGHLFLGGTSVTNAGICQLAECQKLVFVELPPIDLSAAALESLAKCRRLESLLIDERRLRREQLDDLRAALPRIMLNGRTWAQRDKD